MITALGMLHKLPMQLKNADTIWDAGWLQKKNHATDQFYEEKAKNDYTKDG